MNNRYIQVASSGSTVGTSSSVIVSPRPLRCGLVIANSGLTRIWLTLGPTAVVDSGIPVDPGGNYSQYLEEYTGIISAISVSSTDVIGITEAYYET